MNRTDQDPRDRRRVLKLLGLAGAGSAVFARALSALAEGKTTITEEMIRQAEWVSGIALDDDKRKLMLGGLRELDAGYATLRALPLDNGVPPAFRFDATPGESAPSSRRPAGRRPRPTRAARPDSDEDLAFLPAARLGEMIRSKAISSKELTSIYLDRIRRFDPQLHAVITVTEDLARRQAEAADRDLARGTWRGPLHGVPWGAKDLLAVPGHPTTWGSVPYRSQVRPETAAVVERLEAAGAVLIAKTAVGELAWGDVWYGETCRNPWKPAQGSSGSSAGSASASSAGLVGFAIGTETWGSIVSPATRCGVSGLRPTFGRVSRHGCMALSWTMDKIGPLARSVEDLALVFAAIHGADPRDPASVDRRFDWPAGHDPKSLRIGVVESLFDEDYTKWADPDEDPKGYEDWKRHDRETLDTLRRLGFRLVPLTLPSTIPSSALASILTAEAAAAFDDLTRSGRDATLVRQVEQAWPNVFRQGQTIPAVEYIRANRFRTLLMGQLDRALAGVDVWVVPSFGGDVLLTTNLTGHPAVVVPNGFRSTDGTPTSITFHGRLHGETDLLAVAMAYQEATGFHRKRPPIGKGGA